MTSFVVHSNVSYHVSYRGPCIQICFVLWENVLLQPYSLCRFLSYFFTEFIEKLHSTYQALLSGTYRPGQIVVAVPTLSRPAQPKSQPPPNATHEASQANSGDGVDVHSFLEAVLQIIHTSNGVFRYMYVGLFLSIHP